MASPADKHREAFLEEARELLAELETALLELEERPDDSGLVARAFRALHTIKGSGSMFGYDAVAKFTHELETAFERVRSGAASLSKELVAAGLQARDLIKAMLEAPDGGAGGEHSAEARRILTLLRGTPAPAEPAQQRAPASGEAAEGELTTYRIGFKPKGDIFRFGHDPALLLRELAGLGDCAVTADGSGIPSLEDMDPERCYTAWDVVLTTDRGRNAIEDVFIFAQDAAEIRITAIGAAAELGHRKFGEILVDRGDATPDTVRTALAKQKRLGDILEEAGAVKAAAVEAALAEQRHLATVREKSRTADAAMSVRVPAEKLDQLVDLVGELVTVQARLSRTVERERLHGLFTLSEEIERLTAELRDATMSARMMPIGSTFSRFRRLVRDLSAELGKEIELTTEGAETELDKTVLERLGDPLVHLIRNSIDHGIEPPAERLAAGKPRAGAIRLAAAHAGGSVMITIADDGRGLDREAIRQKAVERGLLAADARPQDRELFSCIFAPGFSTAKRVTNVSGRGVGMDVVKQAIAALRGGIEIESAPGAGATVTLTLPLTLAIIDGFLTKVADQSYVFPLAAVEECVELTGESRSAAGQDLVRLRGEVVPFIRLRDRFGSPAVAGGGEQIVVARVGSGRVGFVVDEIVGGHQTVIKNLGRYYRNAEGVSGATILGDGTVALILDLPKIVESAERDIFDAAG